MSSGGGHETGPDSSIGLPTAHQRTAVLGDWIAYPALGSAKRSTHLVKITAALAADLAVLTEALDEPGRDLAADLLRFARNTRSLVPSFVGVTVTVPGRETPFTFTAFEGACGPSDVRASLLLKLANTMSGTDATDDGDAASAVSASVVALVVLYAATSGAFVELAADLVVLASDTVVEVLIDQHLVPTALDSAADLAAVSATNQAIGVLIGLGYGPDEAGAELDRRAAAAGTDRARAAQAVLAGLDATEADGTQS